MASRDWSHSCVTPTTASLWNNFLHKFVEAQTYQKSPSLDYVTEHLNHKLLKLLFNQQNIDSNGVLGCVVLVNFMLHDLKTFSDNIYAEDTSL